MSEIIKEKMIMIIFLIKQKEKKSIPPLQNHMIYFHLILSQIKMFLYITVNIQKKMIIKAAIVGKVNKNNIRKL